MDLFALGQQIPFPLGRALRRPSVTEQAGEIKGWNAVPSFSPCKKYEYGISDEVSYKDHKCAFIRSTADCPPDWPGMPPTLGGIYQTFKAGKYRHKRMRFSAAVKSEGTDVSAALFMFVTGGCNQMVSYDDMYGRNITGPREWDHYKVVLDIPQESDYIHFGIQVIGEGEVWISSATFNKTKDDPTGRPLYPDHPRNLDFSG
jgi:hypothetical protein